jgi:DNA modification methylase
MNYEDFLRNKVVISEDYGFNIDTEALSPMLKPHQRDIVAWALCGGRRAIFASFGLGKTFMQLELARRCIIHTGKPFLIVCPLAVAGEFKRDNRKLCTGYDITYITDTDSIESYEPQIFITNYERIRQGDIDASKFGGVSFDEASILRNLKTETTNYVLHYFKQIPYRFVATATPTPNDYIEILNYADYLGVIDRGHALTRFFQRDPQKAGNLKLYPHKEQEFWQWVSTWAVFINTPADLGHDATGYDLPPINIIEHCISAEQKGAYINRYGDLQMFKDTSSDLKAVSAEKRESVEARCQKAYDIVLENNIESAILWHHLEAERGALEWWFSMQPKGDFRSVYGSQPNSIKEGLLIDFSEGAFKYLLTKPKIAGSGCNFQDHCATAIFVGIDYKFNDFIQAIHRIYRFGQTKQVDVHIIYTDNEHEVFKKLMAKWEQHKKLQEEMTALVKEYGLNKDIIKAQMERQLFLDGKMITIGNATLYNNDTVKVHQNMASNSVKMILTSIPFGNHYEYSGNYNDFGHNENNGKFFEQMDFLVPELLRVLEPGRIAAIHVKDRIRYSYQNGTKFTTLEDFSGQTVANFVKHGFHLMGKITITTDVVRENNQTYRLGWGEQCKDATKMGVGLPEYVLIFRKAPTEGDNAYADVPVTHTKEEYNLAMWQLDAHAYHASSGDRFMSYEELKGMSVEHICRAWAKHNKDNLYDYFEHLKTCEHLDELGKMSKLFTTLPVHSKNPDVWTDINRMNTLNAKQVNAKKEKHICPLQLDIIKRLILRYTNEGDLVDDPFGGLFSTPYVALELNRKAVSAELNSEYFKDGVSYIHAQNHKVNVPTLFDYITEDKAA